VNFIALLSELVTIS